jgi:preprotein translocase subunit SecA
MSKKSIVCFSNLKSPICVYASQALFRQFARLSGMTGTALADATEIELTYGLKVTPVPTALPIARRDYPDVAFKTRKGADEALVKEVINVGGGESDGRPCLIGTTSVAQSEQIVAALARRGVKAELLNASPKNAPRESELIAQAGRIGVVTVATNMAGRGTDILLGGCPTTMARIKTRSILVQQGVISTEEAQTLPPTPADNYFPCPLDEDTSFALKNAAAAIKKKLGTEMTAIDLDELLTVATDTTEGPDDPEHIVFLRDAADAVKELYKEVLSEEKEAVKERGGLYVMGTNRHESSRIDQQLRGRAGRQGDPGTSRFFLSFEDDMFVVFGGDSLKNILKTFRVSDDMPVEAPQVSKALDKVQVAVEEKYRDIREQILQFDDVLDSQRKLTYNRRQKILFSSLEDTLDVFREYNAQTVASIVKAQTSEEGSVNVEKILEKIAQFFPSAAPFVTMGDLSGQDEDKVTAFISVAVDEIFTNKVAELDTKAKAEGRPPMSLARSANYINLITVDNAWSDHLQNMEDLKESVILRKYQNLDPVAEYREESFSLFQGLEDKMRFNAVYSLWQSLN